MIDKFRGKYSFLSNFYEAPVTYNGLRFGNNEAAFQSQKVLSLGEQRDFTHLSPVKAKQKGRKVSLREDWEDVKVNIMYEICLAKFTQNPELKEQLLLTYPQELEEGNTWGDRYWGTVNGKGENNLGKILMRVREELRKV